MVEEKKPNESAVTSGDFTHKNRLKRFTRAKKSKLQPPKSVESYNTKSRSSVARRNIFRNKFVIVIFLAAIVGLGVYLYRDKIVEFTQKNNKPEQTCQNPASEKCALLKEAIGLLDPTQIQKLHAVVEKIKSTKDYQKDPSLMYVLVIYDINLSDGVNGRQDLIKLTSAFLGREAYDPVLVQVGAVNPDSFEVQIKFLEDQQEQVKNNNWGVTPDGSS